MKRTSKTNAARQRTLFENDAKNCSTSCRRVTMERAELRFLEVARSHGETTTDVIPDDLTDKYADGGMWVGEIPKRLLRDGMIVERECVRSNRPSRHRGRIGKYVILDQSAVDGRIALLRLRLSAGESAATDSPAENSNTITTNGVNENGTAQ